MLSKYLPLSRALFVALAVVALGLAADARAGNIVQDPDFELADPSANPGDSNFFTSGQSLDGGLWNVTEGTVGVDTDTFFVFAGHKSILLDGDNSGPDSLTQTLATSPGQIYTISFWANSDVPNLFSVTFGGNPVSGAPTSIVQNGFPGSDPLSNSSLFVLYAGTAIASSNSTDLTFTVTALPTLTSGVSVEIDNVSVAAVPEPSTLTLAAIGAVCALGYVSRRRRAPG